MVVPKSNDWCLHKKKRIETKGLRPYEHMKNQGRDLSCVATGQRLLRISGDHQKLEKAREDFFPRAFRERRA